MGIYMDFSFRGFINQPVVFPWNAANGTRILRLPAIGRERKDITDKMEHG
jgi:hypothetical protein